MKLDRGIDKNEWYFSALLEKPMTWATIFNTIKSMQCTCMQFRKYLVYKFYFFYSVYTYY
jgi:hypothetical protein